MKAHKIAQFLGARSLGDDVEISGLAPLFLAKESDLSFVIWPKDIRRVKKTKSGCVLAELAVAAEYAHQMPSSIIVIDDFFEAFFGLKTLIGRGLLSAGLCDSYVSKDAFIHPSAHIYDHVVINDGCRIGPGVVIHPGTIVGKNGEIGANTVIGAEGFVPYGMNPAKILPSLGYVHIGDNVRIGALCTIDRGLIGATRINNNTLIDNMVHVGHDAVIGENVIIAGQSGLAGNVHIGDHVTIGGQVGITPHVVVNDGARISGKSMVHCDIKAHEIWSGNPSVPHAVYLKAYGRLKRSSKESIGVRT